jgi:hypothetical protein
MHLLVFLTLVIRLRLSEAIHEYVVPMDIGCQELDQLVSTVRFQAITKHNVMMKTRRHGLSKPLPEWVWLSLVSILLCVCFLCLRVSQR